ncbi:MAG: hypothetical protein M1816_001461 [Peltula sp. TS41687]|nr:MAG: hypothetical protein M1816_001461 [Peltula sp. TS41687]
MRVTSPSAPSPTAGTPEFPLTPRSEEASLNSSYAHSTHQAAPESKGLIRLNNTHAPNLYIVKPALAGKEAQPGHKRKSDDTPDDARRANEKRRRVQASDSSQIGGLGHPETVGKPHNVVLASPVFNNATMTTRPPHGVSSPSQADLPKSVGSIIASEKAFVHPGQVLGTQVFGRLLSTPESSLSTTIPLRQRETSWGRGFENTMVYPNGQDTRIPKYAIDIIFWRKGLKDDLDKAVKWETLPDVKAWIKTRAKKIWVNDVPLVAWIEDKGNPFGELYTGDKITVWKDKAGKKRIEFVCEFTHGLSKQPRPEDTRFCITGAADFKALKDDECGERG